MIQVWPEIARLVGLEAAPPQAVSLAELMVLPDKTKAWEGALQGSGLSSKPEAAANNYGRLIAWEFADFCFGKASCRLKHIRLPCPPAVLRPA